MLYRYELGWNGKNIGVGVLMGISELDGLDDEQLEKLTKDFDDYLPIPPNNVYIKKQSKSYFTQKGNERFQVSIERLKQEYIRQGFSILEYNMNTYYQENILYQDEYQIIIGVS